MGKNTHHSNKYSKLETGKFIDSLKQFSSRVHGEHPPTYESASLRRFKHGRTECIRSCTLEASEFVRHMDGEDHDNYGKRHLFLQAIKSHVDYTLDAMNFKVCVSFCINFFMSAS